MHNSLFIHLLIKGFLGYFQFFVTMSKHSYTGVYVGMSFQIS